MPRPMYFLAMLTTSRRLASVRRSRRIDALLDQTAGAPLERDLRRDRRVVAHVDFMYSASLPASM